MRAAQVFDPRNLLPSSFGEECVLQTQASSPVSQPWQLRLELRCTESALPGKSRGEFRIIIIVLGS